MKLSLFKSVLGGLMGGAMVLVMLGSVTSSAFADEAGDALAIYKKGCNEGWSKGSKGEMGPDAKIFGLNFCDCAMEKYISYMQNNSGKKPPSNEEDSITQFCVNKGLLKKTEDLLENTSNIDASLTQSTCLKAYTTISAQMGMTASLPDSVDDFCECSSVGLADALNANVSDEDFFKRLDQISIKCAKTEAKTAPAKSKTTETKTAEKKSE